MFGELKGATVLPKLSQTVNRIQFRKGWHTTVAFFGWIEKKFYWHVGDQDCALLSCVIDFNALVCVE